MNHRVLRRLICQDYPELYELLLIVDEYSPLFVQAKHSNRLYEHSSQQSFPGKQSPRNSSSEKTLAS